MSITAQRMTVTRASGSCGAEVAGLDFRGGVDAATIDRYRRQARADATQRVHALAAASGLKPGDWEPCIVEGEASQRIVEHEQEKDCDLVVLGKHGQSATEDLLLGSVSKHVLAEGSTDVLVSTAHEA